MNKMFFGTQHLHFTGIGGIGMSGIAEVLLNLGYTISGSDLKTTSITERLAGMGAKVYEGHATANVAGAKAVVVGGRVGTMGSNARVGHSDFLVVESDESDRSFLKLAPIVAVVTNIDREHLDCYSSIDDIRASFVEFVNKVPFYGAAILCLDDANVQSIMPLVKC